VNEVDATGAGDVFAAAFILGTLRGWPLRHRLAFGNLCAALSVQQVGGSLAAPDWRHVADWFSTTQERARTSRAARSIRAQLRVPGRRAARRANPGSAPVQSHHRTHVRCVGSSAAASRSALAAPDRNSTPRYQESVRSLGICGGRLRRSLLSYGAMQHPVLDGPTIAPASRSGSDGVERAGLDRVNAMIR